MKKLFKGFVYKLVSVLLATLLLLTAGITILCIIGFVQEGSSLKPLLVSIPLLMFVLYVYFRNTKTHEWLIEFWAQILSPW